MSNQREHSARARARVMQTLREAAEAHPNPVQRLVMGTGAEVPAEGLFRGE